MQSNRGYRASEAAERIGVGRTKFLELAKTDPMLTPIRLGAATPIWTEHILEGYLAAKEAQRNVGSVAEAA